MGAARRQYIFKNTSAVLASSPDGDAAGNTSLTRYYTGELVNTLYDALTKRVAEQGISRHG